MSTKNSLTRVAIVGLGRVAEKVQLPACAALGEVQLVGAAERDAERRQRIGKKFGVRALYADAMTLLEKEKPEVVIVATPPDTHHELCLLALEHGAHVFCEKPFVSSLAEADEVIAAAEQRGLLIWVNNQFRYMQLYQIPHERIAAGEFGRLYLLQCWQQMFYPPTKAQGWRARLKQSTLYEFGTHALDLICFLFEALPESVSAHMPRVCTDIESDVLVQMALCFPGERLATLVLNRVSHAPERYLEMRLDCERASLRISLGGVARASLDWSKALRRPIMRFSFVKGGEARLERGGRSTLMAQERRDAYASATSTHLRKFLEAIRSGERANHAARHARELLRIVFAGYESARTGETVWLNQN